MGPKTPDSGSSPIETAGGSIPKIEALRPEDTFIKSVEAAPDSHSAIEMVSNAELEQDPGLNSVISAEDDKKIQEEKSDEDLSTTIPDTDIARKLLAVQGQIDRSDVGIIDKGTLLSEAERVAALRTRVEVDTGKPLMPAEPGAPFGRDNLGRPYSEEQLRAETPSGGTIEGMPPPAGSFAERRALGLTDINTLAPKESAQPAPQTVIESAPQTQAGTETPPPATVVPDLKPDVSPANLQNIADTFNNLPDGSNIPTPPAESSTTSDATAEPAPKNTTPMVDNIDSGVFSPLPTEEDRATAQERARQMVDPNLPPITEVSTPEPKPVANDLSAAAIGATADRAKLGENYIDPATGTNATPEIAAANLKAAQNEYDLNVVRLRNLTGTTPDDLIARKDLNPDTQKPFATKDEAQSYLASETARLTEATKPENKPSMEAPKTRETIDAENETELEKLDGAWREMAGAGKNPAEGMIAYMKKEAEINEKPLEEKDLMELRRFMKEVYKDGINLTPEGKNSQKIREEFVKLGRIEAQILALKQIVEDMKSKEGTVKAEVNRLENSYLDEKDPAERMRKLNAWRTQALRLEGYQIAINDQAARGRQAHIDRLQAAGQIHRKLGTKSLAANIIFGARTAAYQVSDAFQDITIDHVRNNFGFA